MRAEHSTLQCARADCGAHEGSSEVSHTVELVISNSFSFPFPVELLSLARNLEWDSHPRIGLHSWTLPLSASFARRLKRGRSRTLPRLSRHWEI